MCVTGLSGDRGAIYTSPVSFVKEVVVGADLPSNFFFFFTSRRIRLINYFRFTSVKMLLVRKSPSPDIAAAGVGWSSLFSFYPSQLAVKFVANGSRSE